MTEYLLCNAEPGKTYEVLGIKDEERLNSRLSSMGIIPGETLELCQNLKKQPVLVFVRDTLVAIGRGESEKIKVGEKNEQL